MIKSPNPHFKIFFAIIAVFVLGTLGYYTIEDNWSLLDSFYMTAITITTVGFGETLPLSSKGRIFTIILIFVGLGTAISFTTQLAKTLLENQFQDIFGGSKMRKRINKLTGHYIVCGFGRIGRTICSSLDKMDIPFVVIDKDEDSVKYSINMGFLTVLGTATNDTILIKAGIKRASGIISNLHQDADNLCIALASKELNANIFVISRGNEPSIEKRMKRAGADRIVYPLKLGGEQIARLIAQERGLEKENDNQLEHSISGMLGYSMKMYTHFSDINITIQHAQTRTASLKALVFQSSEGIEIENPELDELVSKNDRILFVTKDRKLPIIDNPEEHIVEWSDVYSVGIEQIDEEHKTLFDLVDTLLLAIAQGKEKEILSSSFNALIEYTHTHFANEEKVLEKAAYPQLEAHKKEHKRLTEAVIQLNKDKQCIFPSNISDFLLSWITDHILNDDTTYSVYLLKNGFVHNS